MNQGACVKRRILLAMVLMISNLYSAQHGKRHHTKKQPNTSHPTLYHPINSGSSFDAEGYQSSIGSNAPYVSGSIRVHSGQPNRLARLLEFFLCCIAPQPDRDCIH